MDSRIKLNSFEFHKGNIGGIWEALRTVEKGSPEDALTWEKVNIPHCYNSFDSVDPNIPYYQGPSWYRKTIEINNPHKNGNTFIFFEGAGQIIDVYLDKKHIHTHFGGYDEWKIDLTPYLIKNKTKYKLIIKCDNSRNLNTIPSDLSDFTIFGGLYRNIHLIYEPELFIQNLYLTPKYNEINKSGELVIKVEFNKVPKNCKLKISIKDKNNQKQKEFNILENKEIFKLKVNFDRVDSWSPNFPNLYTCEIKTEDSTVSDFFGFRSYKFEKNGPFYLNGNKLLLKGTHRHEDHAAMGAAQSLESITEEMNLIKEMGANFIRLGHYQQNRAVLNLCDKLGILVWEEIPWCRGGLGNSTYKDMGKRMLINMINQHYNHPSIIIWGLGNENDWPGDFETFDKEEIKKYMKELNNLSHKLDNSRKTAIRRCDFAKEIVDVYSPSIWAGWYRGHYKEYKEATIKHINSVNHFLHVEWGADSHMNRFSENPNCELNNIKMGMGTDERSNEASLFGGISRVSKDGTWSENYACDLFDWTLKEQFDIPNLTGTAFWPFKDFSTPLRKDNPIPYINQKGVVQRDLTKKEVFYVVQSYWSNTPMLRLFGHQWKIRWGELLEEKEFRVYSNCQKVELFLDGKSLGIKERNISNFPATGFRWKSQLEEGKHNLKAIAYSNNNILSDEYSFYYQCKKWGIPKKINSKFIEENNKFFWEIEVVDSTNIRCLDFREKVNFSSTFPSPLVTNMGTSTGSKVIECANGRSIIELNNTGIGSILSAYIEGLPICYEKYSPRRIND